MGNSKNDGENMNFFLNIDDQKYSKIQNIQKYSNCKIYDGENIRKFLNIDDP